MITIENADKALKEYYLDAVSAQLNENISPFFSAVEKNAQNVYGKDVKLSLIRGNLGAVMAGGEDDDLPDAYANRYLDICAPLKNLYGTIEISDKALRASRESSGAFVNLVNAEMEGLISSATQNFRRMLFGDGTGELAKVTGTTSETEFVVDTVKDYFVGMLIDFAPPAPIYTPQENKNFRIVAIDKAKSSITVSPKQTNDVEECYVVPHGSHLNELTGLKAIFHADTLYGYKKAEEPFFAPVTADAGGALTEEMLCDMLDNLEENFSSKPDMILCGYKTRKKIAALIADRKRVTNTIDVRTGVGAITVNDVPVYADKFCPDGEIMFVNTADFVLCQLCDWEWLEDEDGKILKQIPGKAAYSATLVKYAELICKKPCGQGIILNA